MKILEHKMRFFSSFNGPNATSSCFAVFPCFSAVIFVRGQMEISSGATLRDFDPFFSKANIVMMDTRGNVANNDRYHVLTSTL